MNIRGIYGTRTRALITKYIREHNLTVDNIGELTDRQLIERLEGIDSKFRGVFVSAFLKGLNETDFDKESIRAARIAEVRRLDNVDLEIVNPGIPTVPVSLDHFLVRDGFPVVSEALAAVQGWLKGRRPNLLTLSGPPGVGKSHLAIAAAQHLAATNHQVMYREEASMLRGLQQGIQSGATEKMLQELEEVPWLVLEEIGTVAASAWTTETLDRIVNTRWKNAEFLRTLVTTNLIGPELPARLSSRLSDISRAQVILIDAPDFRRTGA